MFRKPRPRVPAIFQGRQGRTLEEFVGIYFTSGPERDAARRLWRAIEEELSVDLSALHPDDDLADIFELGNPAAGSDSLEVVSVILLIEDILGQEALRPDGTLGSFREVVLKHAAQPSVPC